MSARVDPQPAAHADDPFAAVPPMQDDEPVDALPREQQEASEGLISSTLRRSKHPMAAVFHVVFKLAAVTTYLLCNMFADSFIFVFVLCVLCLVFDFWTVKNVTGRLLVGLRWWNEVDENGQNHWVFESIQDRSRVSDTDSRIFWGALYLFPVIWVLLSVVAILKFNLDWLMIPLIALALGGANLYGYTKCHKDAKARLQSALANSSLIRSSMRSVGSAMLSSMLSGGGGGGGDAQGGEREMSARGSQRGPAMV